MMENITPKEAKDIAKRKGIKVNLATVYVWIQKYDLGYKISGKWVVNKNLFMDFIEGGNKYE